MEKIRGNKMEVEMEMEVFIGIAAQIMGSSPLNSQKPLTSSTPCNLRAFPAQYQSTTLHPNVPYPHTLNSTYIPLSPYTPKHGILNHKTLDPKPSNP